MIQSRHWRVLSQYFILLPFPFHPPNLESLNCFPFLWFCHVKIFEPLSFQECYRNEIIKYISFGDWLFSLNVILCLQGLQYFQSFIPDGGICISFLFVCFARGLSILLIFPKKQLFVSRIFFIVFLFVISLLLILINSICLFSVILLFFPLDSWGRSLD